MNTHPTPTLDPKAMSLTIREALSRLSSLRLWASSRPR